MRNKKRYITAECRASAKRGDKEAIEKIIEHYIPYIKTFTHKTVIKCFGIYRSDAEEDIMQEIIAAIIKGSPNFRENITQEV